MEGMIPENDGATLRPCQPLPVRRKGQAGDPRVKRTARERDSREGTLRLAGQRVPESDLILTGGGQQRFGGRECDSDDLAGMAFQRPEEAASSERPYVDLKRCSVRILLRPA